MAQAISKRLRRLSAGKTIALGFFDLILIGAVLLTLPIAGQGGVRVRFFDALFTAASAACVTGLSVVETGSTWSVFGKSVILALIQIGGLGVAALGVSVTLLAGRDLRLRDRQLLKEGWNVSGYGEVSGLLGRVLLITVCAEALGALLSWPIFARDFGAGRGLWMAVFHSVSSFNNAGFDILGDGASLMRYGDRAALNLITAFLIIAGGLGYLAILDLIRFPRHRRLSLQTKVVLLMTGLLLVLGTLLLRLAEPISWMGAFFHSVSARTAGFSTWDLAAFRPAGVMVMCLLMFVGASPGSTGGGMKTTTIFALFLSARSTATGRPAHVFRRRIPQETLNKAFIVTLMGAAFLLLAILLLCLLEPAKSFIALVFEAVSAFCTVGLSILPTPELGTAARVVLIVCMFVGRLGPLTIATLWRFTDESEWTYSQEGFTIG
jgi:trk system potassium uptake protein TrkH